MRTPSPTCGSSPRVRGTVRGHRTGRHLLRFIPACAGNGTGRPKGIGQLAVHPRVCGEREPALPQSSFPAGSSPRVRGTATTVQQDGTGWRFIPACAGNGTPSLARPGQWTVHPRVCGERLGHSKDSRTVPGSSPRVRGTGTGRCLLPPVLRFIPACAGNGSAVSTTVATRSVHPRVCGERGSQLA